MKTIENTKLIHDDQVIPATPEDVAELFASMDNHEQARFFNHIDKVATNWLPMQLQYITEDNGLTLAGRRVMQYIGEYSHWGLCRWKSDVA